MQIIIPYKNTNAYRDRNLRYVLKYYLDNSDISKVILVEQETETNIENHNKLLHVKLKLNDEYFCRSTNINTGAKYVSSDIICIVDADCLIDKKILKNIDKLIENCDIFYPFSDVNFLSEGHTRQLIRDNKFIQYKPFTLMNVNRYKGGALFIKKDCFNKINGYEKEIKGWGREDDTFIVKCKRLNYKIGRIDEEIFLTHLFHNISNTDEYKKTDRYKLNSEILALYKRMNDEDFNNYINNKVDLYFLLNKYRKDGKLKIIINIETEKGEINFDSSIYDVKFDKNNKIGLNELFESIYQEDGKKSLENNIKNIENILTQNDTEELEIIEKYKKYL